MKAKSPFAMKSPLLAYKSDMRGNYANPKYVKEELVGVKIGEALTKAGTDIFSGLTTKPKSESGDGGGSGGDVINNITLNGSNGESVSNADTDLNRRTEVLEEQGSGGFSGQSAQDLLGRNLTTKESKWKDDEVKRLGGIQQYRDHYKIGKEKDKFHTETTNEYENQKLTKTTFRDLLKNPISMKGSPNKLIGDTMDPYGQINPGAVPPNQAQNDLGAQPIISADGSPVKHNTGAAGAIGNAYSLAGGVAGIGQRISNQAQQRAAKSQQSGSGIFGTIAQAASQGVSAVGSISQQINNQAQQRAADAGGSTGVDPFLPPPNQVAETGSYGGGGDRILEMDSNPVGNQSIGRDTNLTSQLFGSGQRASMLAMKGTPLHDKGHADDYEGHTHRKKGGSYKEGDYMDETDMETSYPKLHTQDVGEIKRDKKSQFMVSKNEDYNPTKIDTIRPLKGKEFKMGWGDAERNISTNPKYKKSK